MKLRILFASDFSKWSNPELAINLSKLLGIGNPDKVIDLRKVDKSILTKLGYDKSANKDTLKGIYNYVKSKSGSKTIPDKWIEDDGVFIMPFSHRGFSNESLSKKGIPNKHGKYLLDKIKNILPPGDGEIRFQFLDPGEYIQIDMYDKDGENHSSHIYWNASDEDDEDKYDLTVDNPFTNDTYSDEGTCRSGQGHKKFMELLDKWIQRALGSSSNSESESSISSIPREWIDILSGAKKIEAKKDRNKVTILTDRWDKDGLEYTTGFSEGVIGTRYIKDVGSNYRETKFITDKLTNIYPCGDGTIKYRDTEYGGNIDVTIKDDKGKDHYSQLYWGQYSDADFVSIKVDNPITNAKIHFTETEYKRGLGKMEWVRLFNKFLKAAVGRK